MEQFVSQDTAPSGNRGRIFPPAVPSYGEVKTLTIRIASKDEDHYDSLLPPKAGCFR
jgi:hypothetical protein